MVVITLPGRDLKGGFLGELDEVLARNRFQAPEHCYLAHSHPEFHGQVSWRGLAGEVAGEGGLVMVGLGRPPDLTLRLRISYKSNQLCYDIRLDSYVSVSGWTYINAKEKEHAELLEALCLDLHRSLGATDTYAANDNYVEGDEDLRGEMLFHFSEAEWKPLGDLPVDDDEESTFEE